MRASRILSSSSYLHMREIVDNDDEERVPFDHMVRIDRDFIFIVI